MNRMIGEVVTVGELAALLAVALVATWLGSRIMARPRFRALGPLATTLEAPGWLLVGAMGLFCLLLGSVSILRHAAFESNAVDLGMMDQLVWNSAHGRLLQSTFVATSPSSFLGHHFSPLIAALGPLYWIASTPYTLLVVQVLSVVLTSGLIYALALRLTGYRWLAAVMGLTVLLHPLIHEAVLYDFHQDSLGMVCLALGFVGISYKRWRWAAIGWALSLLVKEEMTVYWMAVGLFFLAVEPRYRLQALLFTLLNGIILVLLILVVIPAFQNGPNGSYQFYSRYSSWGGSADEIITFMVTQPLQTMRQIFLPTRVLGYLLMLLPVALFLLWGRFYPLILLLPLAINSLADFELQHRYLLHYSMLPLVVIVYAAVQSAVLIQRRAKYAGPILRLASVFLVLTLCLFFFRESQVGERLPDTLRAFTPDTHDRIAAQVLQQVPPEAAVIAQNQLLPHLSQREWAAMFGGKLAIPADFYVLDVQSSPYPFTPEEYAAEVKALLADPDYGVAHLQDSFIILQRGASRAQNEAALAMLEQTLPEALGQ